MMLSSPSAVAASSSFSSSRFETIIVAFSDLDHGFHLLAWTINMAARPGDVVISLHLQDRGYDEDLWNFREERSSHQHEAMDIRESRFKILQDLCDAKQVHLNLKLSKSNVADKTLIEKVSNMKASTLVVTISAHRSQRHAQRRGNSLFTQLSKRCSVIVVRDYKVLFRKEKKSRVGLLDEDELLKYEIEDGVKAFTEGIDTYSIVSCHEKPSLDTNTPYSPKRVLDSSHALNDFDDNLTANDRTGLLTSSKKSPILSELLDDEDSSLIKRSQSCLSIWTRGRKVSRSYTFPPLKQSKNTTIYHNILGSPLRSFVHRLFNVSLPKRHNLKMNQPVHTWKNFTYEEILKATNFFSPDNLVGKGGHSKVYKGLLDQGQLVAVKRLIQSNSGEQLITEFLMEIGMLCQISHPNIARFVGFCSNNGLYLVFHFLEHGSLESRLHDRKFPTLKWTIRYRIAVGTARGLHYLHSDCQRRIIHRDIKSSNILLGSNFEAQISDFGLAKCLPYQCSQIMTEVEGTFGYLAPEYVMHGIVDEKTDVFAFGVLLLELITGCKPIEGFQPSLLMWARPFLEAMNIEKLVDHRLHGIFNPQEMQSMMMAAALCVQQSPQCRPSMRQVLQLLTDDLTLSDGADSVTAFSSRSICLQDPGFDSDYSSSDYHDDLLRHREIAMQF